MQHLLLGLGLLSAALVACGDAGPQGFYGSPYGSYGAGTGDAGTSSGGSGGGGGSTGSSSGGARTDGGTGGTTAAHCTSGTYYVNSGGDQQGTMAPGEACVACHNAGGGDNSLSIGGTVYPTLHESTDCNGVSVAGATVVITDANNTQLTLQVDGAGNFYSSQTVVTPYKAAVLYNGKKLDMISAQTSGDCNSCHGVTGTHGAPGRILLP